MLGGGRFMLDASSRLPWHPEVLPCPVARLVCARCPWAVPDVVLERLHPAEQAYAATLSGVARRDWVAGRLCLAAAIARYGERVPMLVRRSGAAVTPTGVVGSISQKGSVAVAVASRELCGIGVDLEWVDGNDGALAGKVLTVGERSRLDHIGSAQRPAFVTAHFSLKEAVYKAAREDGQEGMEFQDIEVELTQRALERQGVWTKVRATVANARSESQGLILRDGRWVLAVATRAE